MQDLLQRGAGRGRLRPVHRPHLPALLLRGHRGAGRARPRAGRGEPSRWSSTCAARATSILDAVDEMIRWPASRAAPSTSRTSRSPAATTGRARARTSRAPGGGRAARGCASPPTSTPTSPAARCWARSFRPGRTTAGTEATLGAAGRPRSARQRMRAMMADPAPADWDNFWKWSGPEGIVDRRHPLRPAPRVAGTDAGRRRADAGQGPLRRRVRPAARGAHGRGHGLLLAGRGGGRAASCSLPFVNVCTDGLLGGRPHPRAYGTYPRVLGALRARAGRAVARGGGAQDDRRRRRRPSASRDVGLAGGRAARQPRRVRPRDASPTAPPSRTRCSSRWASATCSWAARPCCTTATRRERGRGRSSGEPASSVRASPSWWRLACWPRWRGPCTWPISASAWSRCASA